MPLAALGFALPSHAAVTIQSYWNMGEAVNGSGQPQDLVNADGAFNHFNNNPGTSIQTASPATVGGSTAYLHTNGGAFNGAWMYTGTTAQTVPVDNWGIELAIRSTATAGIPLGVWRSVLNLNSATSGGLALEAKNVGGTVYWEVNRAGQANLIIPKNSSTTVIDNTWYNIALVKSGGTLTFYIDGESVGSSTGSVGTNDGLLHLGIEPGTGASARAFAGDFDEMRFFTFSPGAFNPATDLIPEPSVSLLGSLGVLALLRRRR
jgi:hypothetical protein